MTEALEATAILYAFWTVAATPIVRSVFRAKARPFHTWGNPGEVQYYHWNEEHDKQASSLTEGSHTNFACHGRGLAIEESDETLHLAGLAPGASRSRLPDFADLGQERLLFGPAEDYVSDRTFFIDKEVCR